ncbi:MAG: pectate lyase [Candidatus Brocadiia bacterium]|nr:MAG: pectate lyase [Candidatus Brocadiia bacterium]
MNNALLNNRKKCLILICLVISVFFVISQVVSADQTSPAQTAFFELPDGVKLEVVRIPPGTFMMGSPKKEPGRSNEEGPVHKVRINYEFYMGKYEVTQAQWYAVMKIQNAKSYGLGDNLPVYYVSWDDCRDFVSKLNRLGLPGLFRLPSEAEWEYACRAGTKTRYYFGDGSGSEDKCEEAEAGTLPGKRSDYMWYCGNNVKDDGDPTFAVKPAGQRHPNKFGLYDMHGNVWEWCLDQYHPNYNGAPNDGSSWQTWDGAPRVLRGGAYDYHAMYCRSASRCGYSAERRYTFHGLRLVWLPYEKYSEQWFKSWAAEQVGDNMISYQSEIGAWPKNMRMEAHGYQGEKFTKNWGTSIDNSATHSQLNFMAKLYYATGKKRFKKSFIKGLDYLLMAQYDNGGWPQRYPLSGDYGDLITLNDDAMTGVMELFESVICKPDNDLVDKARRKKVKEAYDKGLRCILDCQQIDENGSRTIWGAQHDPVSLEPRSARSYEPPSLCSRESASIVLFLMSIEDPSVNVIKAVEDAAAWFDKNKITGIRLERKDDDVVVVSDPAAAALWARFCETKTAKPLFSGRDGIIKYRLSEIEKERRRGYQWYCTDGQKVLDQYPEWKKKLKP